MDSDQSLHHHLNAGYRALQPNLPSHPSQHPQHHQHVHPGQQHHPQHSPHQGYAAQNGLDLSSLVNDEYHHDLQRLQAVNHAPVYHQQSHSPFDNNHGGGHRHMQHEHQGSPHTPDQQQSHPSLRPYPLMHQAGTQHNAIPQLQQDDVFGAQTPTMGVSHAPVDSHLSGQLPVEGEKREETGEKKFRVVANPPDLEAWRQKLFDVNELITLSEDDYYTYFPHVDNVYSHRSTQRYKRKPFVSHYWDCRLKGRPPGTPKSEDPAKKKRKRTARERDLCDVKIKITEYFEGAMLRPGFVADDGNDGDNNPHIPPNGEHQQGGRQQQMQEGVQQQHHENVDPNDANNYYASPNTPQPHLHTQFQAPPQQHNPVRSNFSPQNPHPGAQGARYFTIQRVNGNGGNGKGDGVAGPHKHTLADSDRVKKNSVTRHILKEAKEIKRATGASGNRNSIASRGGGVNLQRATGEAANTIRRHSKAVPKDGPGVVFFADCRDVESQRVWIALEVLGVPYQYVESDKTCLPDKLLEVCSRPEIPAVRKGSWGIGGAETVLEYLNEVAERQSAPQAAGASAGTAAGASNTTPSGSSTRRTSGRAASQSNPSLSGESSTAQPNATDEAAKPWAGRTNLSSPAALSGTLLPADPQDRAYARYWCTFILNTIHPAYLAYLRHSVPIVSPDPTHSPPGEQTFADVPPPIFSALQDSLIAIIAAASPAGPFFSGKEMGLVDVVLAPTVIRVQAMVGKRGWLAPQRGTRWEAWVTALEGDARVRGCSCEVGGVEEEWDGKADGEER